MRKEEDIFKLFNEMDELIDSVNLDNNNKLNIKKTDINDIPKINEVYLNDSFEPIVVKEEIVKEEKIINKELVKEENIINKELVKEENSNEVVENIEESNSKINNEEIKKERKRKKKKKSKKWVITFAIFDVIAIICLFLMYGPITYFRNLWVTSAMTTMTHQYLAYVFFDQEQIDKIMANNIIIEVEGNTNTEEIQIEVEPPVEEEIIVYSSPEEEQVLKKDEGNDLFKVIDIEGDGYKGHMLVVYDPSKIKLRKSTGRTLDQFVARENALAGINAGGFTYSKAYGYTLTGVVIIDGQVVADNGDSGFGGGIIGFNNENVLVLTKSTASEALAMGIRDAVSFGPFLIVNGVASQFRGNGGYGIAPRTAIGQRKDGIVLMLVIDGRRPGHSLGVDMVELTNIMLRYGAYNASNLDGGGSSSMAVGTEILSVAGGHGYSGERYLPSAWLVMP